MRTDEAWLKWIVANQGKLAGDHRKTVDYDPTYAAINPVTGEQVSRTKGKS